MASNHLIQAVGFSAAGLCACIAIAHAYQRQRRAEPTQAGPLAGLARRTRGGSLTLLAIVLATPAVAGLVAGFSIFEFKALRNCHKDSVFWGTHGKAGLMMELVLYLICMAIISIVSCCCWCSCCSCSRGNATAFSSGQGALLLTHLALLGWSVNLCVHVAAADAACGSATDATMAVPVVGALLLSATCTAMLLRALQPGAADVSSGGDIELGAPGALSGASDINELKLSGTGSARAL